MDSLQYTNHLYFTILEEFNPLFMLIYDHSIYMDEYVQTPVYDIVPPGFSDAVRINANAKTITPVNSALLFPSFTSQLPTLTCIPDGNYQITYKVQPYDAFFCTRNEFRTTSLDLQLDEAYAALQLNLTHGHYTRWQLQLLDVEMMIRSVKALARLNNVRQASEVFRVAKQEADKLTRIIANLTV
jgi:hypothetical protein